MDKPTILVASNTSATELQEFIQSITKCEPQKTKDDQIHFLWKIETKYYTAEVNFLGITKNHYEIDDENLEALIILTDSNNVPNLSQFEHVDPEIKLLVTKTCTQQSELHDWCSKNEFELIELQPSEQPTKNEDEIIIEKFGFDRVVEILQTHTWPNLVMNDESSSKGEASGDFGGLDEFADLFQNLSVMKEGMRSLSSQQRKQCAEQMVTAFWRAIGGDEEEIADV